MLKLVRSVLSCSHDISTAKSKTDATGVYHSQFVSKLPYQAQIDVDSDYVVHLLSPLVPSRFLCRNTFDLLEKGDQGRAGQLVQILLILPVWDQYCRTVVILTDSKDLAGRVADGGDHHV